MNRNIRVFVSLVLGVSLLLTLSGCVKPTASTPTAEPPDSAAAEAKEALNFRITWKAYSGRGEAIGKIVSAYNAVNQTPYEVVLVDGDEDLSAITASLETNDVDVYMLPYRYVQYLGHENQLKDLSADFAPEKALFYDQLWELGLVNGKVYGLPWLGHSMGLIYNADMLRRAGVDPASITSLEALVAACELVEAKTDAQGIGLVGAQHNDLSWMVNQFVYGFGGKLVDEAGAVAINSPEAHRAIDFYKNQLGPHAQPTWTEDTGVEVMNHFRAGTVAFEIQGLWGITDIWKNGKPFETGVIPLESIGLYPEVGPMMLALQPDLSPEKQAAAKAFMTYLISIEGQKLIMDGEYSPEHDAYYPFRLPVRKDIGESGIFDKYPEFSVFLSGFAQPSIDVPVPLWQTVKDTYYAPKLHQVMKGELSIDDCLKAIEKEGNQVLKGGQ